MPKAASMKRKLPPSSGLQRRVRARREEDSDPELVEKLTDSDEEDEAPSEQDVSGDEDEEDEEDEEEDSEVRYVPLPVYIFRHRGDNTGLTIDIFISTA